MPEILALALTVLLVVLTAIYARRFGIGKEISFAGARALVQVLLLASIITLLFRLPLYWSLLVLMTMAAIAGHTINRQYEKPWNCVDTRRHDRDAAWRRRPCRGCIYTDSDFYIDICGRDSRVQPPPAFLYGRLFY